MQFALWVNHLFFGLPPGMNPLPQTMLLTCVCLLVNQLTGISLRKCRIPAHKLPPNVCVFVCSGAHQCSLETRIISRDNFLHLHVSCVSKPGCFFLKLNFMHECLHFKTQPLCSLKPQFFHSICPVY